MAYMLGPHGRVIAIAVTLLLAVQSGASQGNPPGSTQAPPPPPPATGPPAASPASAIPPSGAQRSVPPALQTTTRLVQVAVVAHKKGVPVTDLTENDFRVTDNGQEQKLQFFVKETATGTHEPPVQLPPNTWSNLPHGRTGVPPNVTMILYDGLNTRVTDQGYAREKIVEFLSHLRPDDRVALYTLGKNLRVLHDFTSDSTSLLRALSKYKGYNGPDVALSDPEVPTENGFNSNALPDAATAQGAAIDEFLRGQDEIFSQYATVNQAAKTIDALEAIATHVAGIPGRKNLIWISGAFPFTLGYDSAVQASARGGPELMQRDFSEDLWRAARALSDANVAVYPVDAHGLVVKITAATRSTTPYHRGFYDATPTQSENDLTLQTMDTIADRTGGKAFYRTNDFAGAIRAAIDDSQVTYTLAYAPSHNDWDGKFRKIKVTTSRSGVELRYRAGYFAMPDKPLAPTEAERMAGEAQWSPMEATEIAMSVHAGPGQVEGRPALGFRLTVDSSGLRFTDEDGRHSTNLLLLMTQKAEDGRVVHTDSRTIAVKMKDDTYQTAMKQGLQITAGVVLDPAATRLRVVMLDQSTGRLGSVDIPTNLAAPPPTTAPSPGASPGGNPPAANTEKPKP
jgi:VWFA-related protein